MRHPQRLIVAARRDRHLLHRPRHQSRYGARKANHCDLASVLRPPGRMAKKKRSSSKRELINTGRAKAFAKRAARGRFKEMDDVGRSLSADRRRTAKKKVKSGHGDQGDRAKTRARKTASRKRTKAR